MKLMNTRESGDVPERIDNAAREFLRIKFDMPGLRGRYDALDKVIKTYELKPGDFEIFYRQVMEREIIEHNKQRWRDDLYPVEHGIGEAMIVIARTPQIWLGKLYDNLKED